MKLKSFLFVLTLIFSLPTLANSTEVGITPETSTDRLTSSEEKTISTGRYVGGGITSLFISWGIGHAIQGRYSERGWIFTAGGALTLIGAVGVLSSVSEAERTGAELSATGSLFAVALLAGLGIRIWEIIDVWMIPSHYKVVKESPFQVKPLAYYDQKNLNLGLSLNYSF